MKRSIFSLILALLPILSSVASAKTWYAYPGGIGYSIQGAINAASDGDSVVVTAGRYPGAGFDFMGKAITVTSQWGPAYTEIYFGGGGVPGGPGVIVSGFVFHSGEGPSSVLSGITIAGQVSCQGYNDYAGVHCDGASPTIENMVLTLNQIHVRCVNGANPIIRNCRMTGGSSGCWLGHAPGAWGVMTFDSSPTIVDNFIAQNGYFGNGIECTGGSPVIERNTIVDDLVGVILNASDAIVRNNTIARMGVGGVICNDGSPLIENCIIAYNSGMGGIRCWNSAPVVRGCDLYGNTGEMADSICGVDDGDNFSADPLLCANDHLDFASPCLPGTSPNGALIGALPAGCGGGLTLAHPADMVVPAGTHTEPIAIDGFSITSVSPVPVTVRYEVRSQGPLTFHDNGNPAALDGVVVLEPGATFTPPDPVFEIPVIRTLTGQHVRYSAWIDDVPAFFTDHTACSVQPPVPVLITSFRARAVAAGVELTWDLASDEDILGVRIYRRGVSDGRTRLLNPSALLPAIPARYLDTDARGDETFDYMLAVITAGGDEIVSPFVTARMRPHAFTLGQNHPNPFNPTTTISYGLASNERVTIAVYTVNGARVRTLVEESLPAGWHSAVWNGRDDSGNPVASGVYLYRMQAGSFVETKKLVLLK